MKVVVEDRCVLKKWPALRIVIGRYGFKSSFGANNKCLYLKGPGMLNGALGDQSTYYRNNLSTSRGEFRYCSCGKIEVFGMCIGIYTLH